MMTWTNENLLKHFSSNNISRSRLVFSLPHSVNLYNVALVTPDFNSTSYELIPNFGIPRSF